jgi:hypothetical protein
MLSLFGEGDQDHRSLESGSNPMKSIKVWGIIGAILLVSAIPFVLYGTAAYIVIHFIKKFW